MCGHLGHNLEILTSDHSPLVINIWKRDLITRAIRFRFENSWLGEVECGEVFKRS